MSNELENWNNEESLVEASRTQPTLKEIHRQFLSVSKSLVGITTEQQSTWIWLRELSAERTKLPGFECISPNRDQGQSSRQQIPNPHHSQKVPPLFPKNPIQPPGSMPPIPIQPNPNQVQWGPDSGHTYQQPEPPIVWQ